MHLANCYFVFKEQCFKFIRAEAGWEVKGNQGSPVVRRLRARQLLGWLIGVLVLFAGPCLSFASPCGPMGRAATNMETWSLMCRGLFTGSSIESNPQAFKADTTAFAAISLLGEYPAIATPTLGLRLAPPVLKGTPALGVIMMAFGEYTSHLAASRAAAISQAKAAPSALPASYGMTTIRPWNLAARFSIVPVSFGVRRLPAEPSSISAVS